MRKRWICCLLAVALTAVCSPGFAESGEGTGQLLRFADSPTLNLSNMGSGEWTILSPEDGQGIVLISLDVFVNYESAEITERIYSFTFMGTTPGVDYVSLGYIRDGDLYVCLGMDIVVDDELNVTIDVVDVLLAAYRDYF